MRHRLPVAAAVVAALVGVAGCGDLATPLSERGDDATGASEARTRAAAPTPPRYSRPSGDPPGVPAEDDGVLFDGEFLVVEGVWSLAPYLDGYDVPARDGLLATDRYRRSAMVNGPALYGLYPLTITRHAERPGVPRWCEDVAEVSLRHATEELALFGFEDQSAAMRVPRGDLRVRYCAEGLDRALAETEEDEFDGDDWRLYSARNLLQVWAAPMAPDVTLRVGSRHAARLG